MENFPIEELEARRSQLQLPQARQDRDDRRPCLEDRGRARGHPELRQEVDRGSPRDPRGARSDHAGGLGGALRRDQAGSSGATPRPQVAVREPHDRRDRAWPHPHDRGQGQGGAADRRGDDHARQARRRLRSARRSRSSARSPSRTSSSRTSHRASLTGRAATPASSRSARARVTPLRWRTSSSSTTCRRPGARRPTGLAGTRHPRPDITGLWGH